MDACTYESITGFKNYYGFKSLLKNSLRYRNYACDDDSIVFVELESITATRAQVTPYVLQANQVAVVISSTSAVTLWNNLPSNTVEENAFMSQNVNGDMIFFNQVHGNGLVLHSFISAFLQTPNADCAITFAVFNLF